MSERTFTAIFQETDEGWIVGYCEELPGAIVQEHTLEEARESMKEVIHELIEANREVRAKEVGTARLVREELTVVV
jgi:predicted RNase H-like HicB family nuclease